VNFLIWLKPIRSLSNQSDRHDRKTKELAVDGGAEGI
jgi:hypothetical protein